MNEKQLLMQALNRNTSMFANHANEARVLSNSLMRISFDSPNKSIVFQYGSKLVRINLDKLYIKGLEYIGDIRISDILTKIDIQDLINTVTQISNDVDRILYLIDLLATFALEVYDRLDEIDRTLENKADRIHNHSISDATNLQNESRTVKLSIKFKSPVKNSDNSA